VLQIDTAWAGTEVACPHCQGAISLPPADAMQLACPLCSGPFQVTAAMAGQQVGCPHCGHPVTIPPLDPAPSPAAVDAGVVQPPPKVEREPKRPIAADRLPPGMSTRPAARASDRLPPGTAPSREAPATIPVDSLLPPGADFLPPPSAAEEPSRVEALLPPGAAAVDLAAAARPRPFTPVLLPQEAVALPTPDGGQVTIKDTPKTILSGDDEIELARLSREEKSRRRFRRNLILWGICLAILFGVVAAMMW
jgi:DNA-directed RNA polymerase subunit RPC12/RpoP